jgi:CHAT domain-containing protein
MKKLIVFVFYLNSIAVLGQLSNNWYEELALAYEKEDYEACAKLEEAILPAILNRVDSVAFTSFSMLAESAFYHGNYEKALEYFNKENVIRGKVDARWNEEYLYCIQNIAELHFILGNTPDALRYAEELSISANRIFTGTNVAHQYPFHLYKINLQLKSGEIAAARIFAEKLLPTIHAASPFRAYVQNKYGEALRLTGLYSLAEKNLLESITLQKKFVGFDSIQYAKSLSNLGLLYLNQGRYPEADAVFNEALEILVQSEEEEAYYATLNNRALILTGLSLNEEAIHSYHKILRFDSATYGTKHPYYSISLVNLSKAYNNQQNYNQSIDLLQEALQIDSASFGANSYDYGITLNELARTYRLMGDAKRSIPLLEKSREIFRKEAGEQSPDYASVLNNLGISYAIIRSPQALPAFKQSLKIRNKILSPAHPKNGEATDWLTRYYWMQGNTKLTRNYFEETLKNYYAQIDLFFPFLSESEKTKFYFDKLKPSFERFDNFAAQHHAGDKSLLGMMYNNQLNTKALIMYATNKVRNNILGSGDSVLITQFGRYINAKEQLSKLLSQSHEAQSRRTDSLVQVANTLEKELTKRSALFEKTYKRKLRTWQEVRDKLGKDEAAIEIIRYRDYFSDSAGRFTSVIHYVALVIKKNSKAPELVLLQNGNRLESRYINFYRNSIQFKSNDTISYRYFWEPIQQRLNGIKKVYISPDGVYNQINLNTLKNPATGKFLIDELRIDRVTNTRDLLEQSINKSNSQVILYGFPTYNLSGTNKQEEETKRALSRGVDRGVRSGILRYMRGEEGIALLPGTRKEVELISGLLYKQNLEPVIRLTEEADEYSLKKMESPRILHVATHGFFLDNIELAETDNRYLENPLLRSGIILAGAGDFLITGNFVNNTEEDGILTAYEAMNLNLDGTEVVVLSACETALGSVKNGEGVYGLQRALQIAGAKAIVMSMWSVDDDATQELMTLFYENWLRSGNKRNAFREAQLKLKEKYPSPFYWGAFVMVGE